MTRVAKAHVGVVATGLEEAVEVCIVQFDGMGKPEV
jgi:hypothetical protein